jgi:hypothetical protein
MDLQSIRYAAMVSTMTFERAAEVFGRYLSTLGKKEEDPRAVMLDMAHPAVPGWSICSMRVPCAGDLQRARGGTGWLGRDR